MAHLHKRLILMLISDEKPGTKIKSWVLSARQQFDLECLLNGAFFPLQGFLTQADYASVCDHMRLADGRLWPMPITLDVSAAFAESLLPNERIGLVDKDNTPVAELCVRSKWQPDKAHEALQVFHTLDKTHPGVRQLFEETNAWYLGGELNMRKSVDYFDFRQYRHTPAELKQTFTLMGWDRVVAFQTRNPLHRAHFELTLRAAKAANAALLLHPVVGITRPGDIPANIRVRCYEAVLPYYPAQQPVLLSLLPLAMRMAGPREALWHALIRKNYGATHFIVGRDHAGPGNNAQGLPFYPPDAAQKLALAHADEMGLEIMAFSELSYVKQKNAYLTQAELTETDTVENISGTALRASLNQGTPIPEWFSFPEVLHILKTSSCPSSQQGWTLLLTGLSGAGKSTLARALHAKIQEEGGKPVTLLDGDEIRQQLCAGLGFSLEDRNTHVLRLGFVAKEITKHRGITLIAAITPIAATRERIKQQIGEHGGFIEVYVATPISECKVRDTKGLYHQAELGLIQQFTGVSSPYEPPEAPDLVIDTTGLTVSVAIEMILAKIQQLGYAWQ